MRDTTTNDFCKTMFPVSNGFTLKNLDLEERRVFLSGFGRLYFAGGHSAVGGNPAAAGDGRSGGCRHFGKFASLTAQKAKASNRTRAVLSAILLTFREGVCDFMLAIESYVFAVIFCVSV